MNILGISAFYHDSAAALVQDGRIVAAAQEERFTRLKGDASFPDNAVAFCLGLAGITAADVDAVVFYEKPLLKAERLLETYLAVAPRGLRSFLTAIPTWLSEKSRIPSTIRRHIGKTYRGPVLYTAHHESHAASAFFPSPYASAAILTADGVGEWATTTIGAGRGNKIRLLQELRFPHSLGLLYSAFTYYTGFKVNSGEYKVMGLAPYGRPVYADLICDKLVRLNEDGSFWLNQAYFDYTSGLAMTNERFHDLFGALPRRPEAPLTQLEMDVAASIQLVTEEIVLRLVRRAHELTGESRLCLAGGVALNCVANGRILREGPFEDIWVQPAAGDAGGALGAALFAWHQILNRSRTPAPDDSMHGALLGPEYNSDEIGAVVPASSRLPQDELVDRTARLLAERKVVGWFQGRMEFGPRALGSRSILADPRSPSMQSVLNQKIKFRESFRPFAPCVLREHLSDYFELDRESPYMMFTAGVRDGRTLPAVTHVDGSARVQTVDAERHGLFHRLLRRFHELTGCPVLVNTSFNVRGEPIVCSPEDAYRCFRNTHMDALVLGDRLLEKSAMEEPPAGYLAEFELD